MSRSSKQLEERWTPTSIQTAFALRLPNSIPKSGAVSIDLPLLNLGWTFALSFTPEHLQKTQQQGDKHKHKHKKRAYDGNWIPAEFSFRQHRSAIHWENTSICAQISLEGDNTPPLGTMNAVLAHTPALNLPLAPSCTISPLEPNKVWLSVSISECPLADGLFGVRSGLVNEAEIHAQLVRRSGDRVLSRSLATGKLFDVKFLASSTSSTSANTEVSLPTYASLSVLEEHVNLSSCK